MAVGYHRPHINFLGKKPMNTNTHERNWLHVHKSHFIFSFPVSQWKLTFESVSTLIKLFVFINIFCLFIHENRVTWCACF